jgi:branched-chain amino acid transport system permease protein
MKRIATLLFYSVLTIAIIWGLQILVQSLIANDVLNEYVYRGFIAIPLLFITLSVSLNLINGITGQFSLGHAGFYAVGAYLSAGLTYYYSSVWLEQVPSSMQSAAQTFFLILAILFGAACAALAGFLVGMPTLRLRGDYLAIATLGFGEIVRVLFENTPVFGAQRGFTGLPQWVGFGFFWFALVAVACTALCRNLLKSPHGLAFLAVREDEVAAEAMGISTTRYKVTAFVIGAAFAGAAGALLSHWEGSIYPVTFKMDTSIIVVAMVVLGGQGSITGAVVAGAGLKILEEWLRLLPTFTLLGREFAPSDLRMLVFALVLILTMIFRQQGIFGHREIGWGTFGFFKRRQLPAEEGGG